MSNIQNKTVLVTGGAGGIGFKYVEELVKNGAKCVAIVDLPTSPGKTSAETLENKFGKGKAVFYPCDVTKGEDFESTIKKVTSDFNGLDILINNAGMLNDHHWELTIDLNLKALIRGSLVALDIMGKHKGGKGGTIVNIASIVGLEPATMVPVYTASKFGVIGFSRSIKTFYEKTGVRVLVMCPGVTHTPLVAELTQKTLDFVDDEFVNKQLNAYPSQDTDNVARAMVDLIQKGKNGDVWVSEGGQPPYSVGFTHYSTRGTPV